MLRMRWTSVLSRRKTPATTNPTRYAGKTASLFAVVARPPRKNRTKKINFTSGSLTRVAPSRSMIDFVHLGHEPKHDARSDYEDEQPDVVVCEKPAEGEHSPEIGDEA